MSGFRCPFCGQIMSVTNGTVSKNYLDFHGETSSGSVFLNRLPALCVSIYRCPNESCGKETIIASGENGYIENKTVMIEPEAVFNHYPEYIPLNIRNDYEEACMICSRSPKAAATLARRCLQGMIRDFWKVTGKRSLYDELNEIKDKLPPNQWAAIDALRKIGNIGAHMEKDVNVVFDVDPGEAEKLLQLIELLLEKWYIARNDENELYLSIIESEKDISSQKKQDH